MTLLDRYLVSRFLTNFVILFTLICVLATTIDIIIQLDEFMQVVKARVGADAGILASTFEVLKITYNFYGPRIFQLYAYLLGLVTIGAMGFTLAQLLKYRELVAMLASGMSLYRVAWPIIVTAFVLNLFHLVNSNFILPDLAPLLIRSHDDLEKAGDSSYEIPLTSDGKGTLLHTPAFFKDTSIMKSPTFIERDEKGKTTRRILADSATWNEAKQLWELENGIALIPIVTSIANTSALTQVIVKKEPVNSYQTDLTPRVLIIRRYKTFAQMLGPRQIEELSETPGVIDDEMLARIKFGRYSIIVTNILMLIITIPFFLLRQPVNMLKQSVYCALVSLVIMLGAFIGMEVRFEALPPIVGVFLPVIILIPLSLAAISWVRT